MRHALAQGLLEEEGVRSPRCVPLDLMTDPAVQALLTFYETIGTFVKNGLLDRDLVYDWIWAAGVWDRVAPAVARARERTGVPQLFENFEALAAGQRQPTPATA
jgi:Domain of unknown function (DUF4760)